MDYSYLYPQCSCFIQAGDQEKTAVICTIRPVSICKHYDPNPIRIILHYKHDTVADGRVLPKLEMQTVYPIHRLIYDDRLVAYSIGSFS